MLLPVLIEQDRAGDKGHVKRAYHRRLMFRARRNIRLPNQRVSVERERGLARGILNRGG